MFRQQQSIFFISLALFRGGAEHSTKSWQGIFRYSNNHYIPYNYHFIEWKMFILQNMLYCYYYTGWFTSCGDSLFFRLQISWGLVWAGNVSIGRFLGCDFGGIVHTSQKPILLMNFYSRKNKESPYLPNHPVYFMRETAYRVLLCFSNYTLNILNMLAKVTLKLLIMGNSCIRAVLYRFLNLDVFHFFYTFVIFINVISVWL